MTHKSLVLIVDDNPQNLKIFWETLKKHGLNPAAAKDGMQALEFVNRKKPDLILLDIMMPELDGFEVCKRLQKNKEFSDIPIIFLSAKAEKEEVIAGLELGAVDYVTKPFNEKELMTRIHTHLDLKATKDALKQSNASKDKFFSIIAHDLGNVFNGLIGLSNMLIDSKVKDVESLLPLVKKSSEKGYNLLKNLLEWSRIQTGKIQAHPIPLNLKNLVDQNINLLESQASAKYVHLFSKIEKTFVYADEQMINTVIRNLLSNAIKFTPKEGWVEISSKIIGTFIEIAVVDTGVGITPVDIDKLFKIDVSHSTRGTENEEGTGLGLILCQEFIIKNGGNIRVESKYGKGSCFYIQLPLSTESTMETQS